MSTAATYRDTRQDNLQDGLHVTAVKVDFLDGRPREKLELVVKLNGRDYKVQVGRHDETRWSGNVYCLIPSTVIVTIRCLNPFMPITYASVQAPLSLSLSLSSLSDPMQLISVTFTILESTISSRAEAAQEEFRAKKKETITKKLKNVWSVVIFVHSIMLEVSSNIHPTASSPPDMKALRSLMKACENQESCRDEALDLVDEFKQFLSVYNHEEQLRQRAETWRAVLLMLILIENISECILNHTTSRVIGNQLNVESLAKLSNTRAQFTRARKAFDHSVDMEVFKALASVEKNMQFVILREKLSEREDAHFKSGKTSSCLEGTRVGLLGQIMDWVAEETGATPSVFWLRGKAGSGKSTVANTMAQAVQDGDYLLSCFFCKRDDTNLSNPLRVLPTLAYRFAQHHDSYRASIFPLLHTDPRGTGIATTADIDTQFEKLFKGPLAQTVDPLRPHVIVIDALDECGPSSKGQTSLAKCILKLSSLAPWIKVFVTSRDEPAIRKIFSTDLCVQCNINEEKGTDEDIRQYVDSYAKDLGVDLSTTEIRQLVRRAEGLFIWCSTLLKYLSARRASARRRALEPFLSDQRQHGSLTELYQLYDEVVDSAGSHDEDREFTRAILAVVNVTARNRPLSARAIMSFLHKSGLHGECTEADAQDALQELHAVIYIDESTNGAIRAYHTSFYDFLEHKATEAVSGWERPEATHSRIFWRCMDVLNTQLRFNICDIEKPVLNKDIPDLTGRIAKKISEELQYGSRFWFTHLFPSKLAQSDVAPGIRELLCSRKLLFWLEALSLQDTLMQYSPAFAACSSFFPEYPDIVAAANDAHRFIAAFSEAMDSVPHIYLSSLFWIPQNSMTHRNLKLSELPHLELINGKRDHWDAVIWERFISQELDCVAYSPDGQCVACGADNGRIYILNALTGAWEGESLQDHCKAVTCLAYSPNGQFIASGSWDKTVRIWDVKSGEPVFDALIGHTESVRCVAWSPNGRFIASSSDDGTIRIWNTRTGTQEGEPLRGHKGSVCALAYAPGGTHIASGGGDGTIRVWSTNTYQEVRQPLRGHSWTVWSIGYSPDGHTIVSGSRDHTIRTWNAQTGKAIGKPLKGHGCWVRSVMYSPNGQFIVSSSDDCTVRVWDAALGAPVGRPLRGHTASVTSISCSSDGLFIASASWDGTIHVWEVPTGLRAQEQPQGHDGPVRAVAFSPDSHRIITSSADGSIRLWDAETGASIGQPLRGHEGEITSVAYSPDGHFIVSGSEDNTVRIWNAGTGEAVGEPFRGHSDMVLSVAYSSNGSLIASASGDGTVRLWGAQTRSAIGEPLQAEGLDQAWSVAFSPDGRSLACGFGHSDTEGSILVWDISSAASIKMTLCGHSNHVRSVAFSPDGRYIASGSSDCTVQIWDARTGEPQGSPLKGHIHYVLCVAFSPNSSLIASSAADGTIRLWDVQTGLAVGNPLEGHPHWVVSVAFSPDGRSIASAGYDERMNVYTVPSTHLSRALGGVEALWLSYCSCMDEQDGWVKDGDTLLLWIPPPYRRAFKYRARFVISKSAPRAGVSSVDYETLSRYSGTEWVSILSDP